jgi:membrane protease YdiL (CAAX protease family)
VLHEFFFCILIYRFILPLKGFSACLGVLALSSCVEWKGQGDGDFTGVRWQCIAPSPSTSFPSRWRLQISQQIAAYACISFFEEAIFRGYVPLMLLQMFPKGLCTIKYIALRLSLPLSLPRSFDAIGF